MKDILKIPRGNPFKMHLCPQRIAPAQQQASFRDITNLVVRLTRHNWDGDYADFDYTEDGDIIIQVPPTLKCVTYGVELIGTYNGKPWRWADCSVFRVVECNFRSNVQFEESFDVETYYIYDDIIPSYEASSEALVLDTHAHAWFEGGTLQYYKTGTSSGSRYWRWSFGNAATMRRKAKAKAETAEIDAAKELQDMYLRHLYPTAKIHGHRDFANKACPSFDATYEYRKF